MLARERQADIARQLRSTGSVKISELAERYGVSDMTVRRDLDALERLGEAEKVHGGAVRLPRRAYEPGFEAKQHEAMSEKEEISAAALEFIEAGDSIAISAGTTTWALAQALVRSSLIDLTVVTNSWNVWSTFTASPRPDRTLVVTGGVQTPSGALVGPFANATIRSLFVDTLFLGVHGLDPVAGFTTPNMAEAETNRALVSRARKIVVLADHSKWRTIGLASVAPLSAASVVVSDEGLPDEARSLLEREVGQLLLARSATSFTRA